MDKEKIYKIIAEVLCIDPDRVIPEANFRRNLGADSLDLIQLMMVCEETFDIEINDNDVSHINTVQDIFDYAEKIGL